MKIIVNDNAREVPEGMTLQQLVEELKLQGPYAIEINGAVCPKKQHPHTILQPEDRLEIVTIVGGG